MQAISKRITCKYVFGFQKGTKVGLIEPAKMNNIWSIKIQATHILSLWHFEYFWIISLYGHLVYFILKVLAWEFCNMKWGFAKKVVIKSQRQFMYGSNCHGSDVTYTHFKPLTLFLKYENILFNFALCVARPLSL